MTILKGHESRVHSVTFSADGKHIASSSSDYTVKIWDFHSKECTHTLFGHTKAVLSVQFSP